MSECDVMDVIDKFFASLFWFIVGLGLLVMFVGNPFRNDKDE